MRIEQIYTGCLAEAAYYIESDGEAVVIDPLRDPQPYLDRAARDGASIKYVLETHFHADFVSGHLDLAKAADAQIVYGPGARPNFSALIATNGQRFQVGKVQIKVLHTPGHTLESSTFLLIDENGKDYAIFTGDTLFIGDVGRPDLAVSGETSREDLAGSLYDSLHSQILPLADDVIVFPGHGAGSACGKMMSDQTSDTLGHQKKVNYALRADMTRAEFISAVTAGLSEPPAYFPHNARLNREGYDDFADVLKRGNRALSLEEFRAELQADGVFLLDTRSTDDFAAGHIPGAIFIGIDGNFAPWVGALISDLNQRIIFIADAGREEEVITRLARVGYDNAHGYLQGGMQTWISGGGDVATIEEVTAVELAQRVELAAPMILDVRKKTEYDAEHLQDVQNVPLEHLDRYLHSLSRHGEYYIHCAGGYRSLIAASILQARGFLNLVNVRGGFAAIKQTSLPISEFKAPSSML